MKALLDYIQAGLDESLAHFVKGVFAAAIVGAGLYAYQHVLKQNLTTQMVILGLVGGIPAVQSFWKWATTSSTNTQSTEVSADQTVAG